MGTFPFAHLSPSISLCFFSSRRKPSRRKMRSGSKFLAVLITNQSLSQMLQFTLHSFPALAATQWSHSKDAFVLMSLLLLYLKKKLFLKQGILSPAFARTWIVMFSFDKLLFCGTITVGSLEIHQPHKIIAKQRPCILNMRAVVPLKRWTDFSLAGRDYYSTTLSRLKAFWVHQKDLKDVWPCFGWRC